MRKAVLGGGIAPETLALLTHGGSESPRKDSGFALGTWAETPEHKFLSSQCRVVSGPSYSKPRQGRTSDDTMNNAGEGGVSGYAERQINQEFLRMPSHSLTWQQQVDFGRPSSLASLNDLDHETSTMIPSRSEDMVLGDRRRTLLITGLSRRITYKNLTNVIRGGRILYITLRNDQTATVFMLEGAAEFLAHVKRHDLYVETKRVSLIELAISRSLPYVPCLYRSVSAVTSD